MVSARTTLPSSWSLLFLLDDDVLDFNRDVLAWEGQDVIVDQLSHALLHVRVVKVLFEVATVPLR
jgi:hypothetical protein